MFGIPARWICTASLTLFAALTGVLANAQATVNVTSYGALINGTNSTATTAAFRTAFAAAGLAGKVVVPPGTYAIDNSAGPLTINNFQGEFKFEGNAQLVFGVGSQAGMQFNSGTGMRVIGFHSTYSSPVSSPVPGMAALAFNGTTNTFVDDVMVEKSPGPGLYFIGSVNAKVSNASILNSQSQGILFLNSLDAELVNATVTNSGQEGIVFQTNSGSTAQDGAHGANLTVTGAQGHGIAVYGESKVTISGFTVNSSTNSGIYCGTSSGSATPANVLYQGGVIDSPAGFGIEIADATSCAFANIQVNAAGNRGVSGSAPGGTVELRNIRVTGNTTGDGFNLSNLGTVRISDSAAEKSPGYGFFFSNVQAVVATALTAYDVSSQNSLHRAVWFQNGASVVAFDLTLIDDQRSPTGFVVGTSAINTGAIHSVASAIVNGTLQIQNRSTGVSVTSVN